MEPATSLLSDKTAPDQSEQRDVALREPSPTVLLWQAPHIVARKCQYSADDTLAGLCRINAFTYSVAVQHLWSRGRYDRKCIQQRLERISDPVSRVIRLDRDLAAQTLLILTRHVVPLARTQSAQCMPVSSRPT